MQVKELQWTCLNSDICHTDTDIGSFIIARRGEVYLYSFQVERLSGSLEAAKQKCQNFYEKIIEEANG